MTFALIYSILIPILTLGALLYAGIEDLLYREVRKDIVWILMVIIGLILDIVYIIFNPKPKDAVFDILVSVVVGFILGFILFYAGIWGGADTKALWALAILTPVHPFGSAIIGAPQTIPVISSMVFSILVNSGLLTLFYPIILMIINMISLRKGSLFGEVRGKSSQKIRSFLFGYKKSTNKINPKKLHYMFLEELPEKEFEGVFQGSFNGRLDGKFVGIIKGQIKGEIVGKIIGKFITDQFLDINTISNEDALKQANEIVQQVIGEEKTADEEQNILLKKYRSDFIECTESKTNNHLIEMQGKISFPSEFYFIGMIEGIFDGEINCSFVGKINGDFEGTSSNGKISGSQSIISDTWQLKIQMRLDDEDIMEQKQLRTVWQLKKSQKNTVWVMPGLPFVSIMFVGYILYLLFGNLALLFFTI
ncbi:MAG: hypothetical protein ACFFDW_08255 [Candidatus Thorarchaeota archaeon]